MIHRHHAIALNHPMVSRQLLLGERGLVGRRIRERLAHELRHPVVVLGAAACDTGDDERHTFLNKSDFLVASSFIDWW